MTLDQWSIVGRLHLSQEIAFDRSTTHEQPSSPLVVSSPQAPLPSQSAVLRQLLCRALEAHIKEQKAKKAEALHERPNKKRKKRAAAAELKKAAAAELADITSAHKELQAEAKAKEETLCWLRQRTG